MARVLVIDDEENILKTLSGILAAEGHQALVAETSKKGLAIADSNQIDCILLDVWLPDIDGLDVLRELRRQDPARPVIMMSGHSTITTAVEATKLGAYSFLEKPLDLERLLVTLRNAIRLSELEHEVIYLRGRAEDEPVMVGNSPAMNQLRSLIQQIAPTNSRILITGENGTGKEIVARLIFYSSSRRNKPFVKVNCAAIPAELIESELFGHEKGAFTGAVESKPGKFEIANGGTIFLDEVGDMSPSTQAKVLRVLEEQEFERVGGKKTIKVDVRVIAATNQDLQSKIDAGVFRPDLYFRLNVIPIYVPPLRNHREDIQPIAEYYLAYFAMEHNRKVKQLSKHSLELLTNYHWPGNVRELKNVMERLAILAPGEEITPADLVGIIPGADAYRPIGSTEIASDLKGLISQLDNIKLRDAVAIFEREIILKKLEQCEGNVKRTAMELGIERSHLYKKMRALGIDPSLKG